METPEGIYNHQEQGNSPVVFKSLTTLPNYQKIISPPAVLDLTYAKIEYHKASVVGTGYYNLIDPKNPESPLVLYQTGIKTLIKNLEAAYELANSLEVNDQFQDDNATFLVAVINEYGTISNRLVLNTYNSEVFIFLKAFSLGEDKTFLPTNKCVRFDRQDNLKQIAEFIKGKK